MTDLRTRAEVAWHSSTRVAAVDAVRGLAVLLMMVDHLAVFELFVLGVDGWQRDALWVLRLTLTRLSLPAFCLVAGSLLVERDTRPARILQVAAVGGWMTLGHLMVPIGIGLPDVLLVWAIVLSLIPAVRRWPLAAALLAVSQVCWWPIHWDGYQPGLLVLFVSLAFLAPRRVATAIANAGERLPAVFASVGRRPLLAYSAHIVALWGLWGLWQRFGAVS